MSRILNRNANGEIVDREIKKATAHTFTFNEYYQSVKVIPTAATITIYDNAGAAILSAATVSIAASGTMTYTLSGTLIPDAKKNYKIELCYTVSGVAYYQYYLFDVVHTPIEKILADEDLFVYMPELRDSFSRAGEATADGTTTTLIDSRLSGADNFCRNGVIDIFLDPSISAVVSSFASSTRTITFSPAAAAAITKGTRYRMRPTYQVEIDAAFENVRDDLRKESEQISRYIDSYAVMRAHLFATLALICGQKYDQINDKWYIKKLEYEKKYENQKRIILGIDRSGDGNMSEYESKLNGYEIIR